DARIFSDFITQEIRVETENGSHSPREPKAEPLSLEIRNFLDSIDGKKELIVKPEQAVNVTRIAEAALLSSQKGVPIYLDIK
ncbi:MAG: gfo/Idh/MocA family oxidoreductase, partial [Candidatus Nitrosopelagicus sp.]|nr:gfo/Idh/MocA family oxidoreductase [Candidatus Nitrosopelagicus sp.]